MRNLLNAAALGTALATMASIASGATVTVDPAPFTPGPLTLASSTEGTVNQNVTGSIGGVRKDPWEATAFAGSAYTSVQANSSATYAFATTRDSIDLLWGTPDDYNFVDFFLAGVAVDSVGGGTTGIANFADQTTNQFVTITASGLFDSVKFRSTTANAFEYATVTPLPIVTPAPVPLPAAGLLLLGAMGGLAGLRRRRKA